LAHLPPDLARQQSIKTTFSAKWPPHSRAEGGPVEPGLGGNLLTASAYTNPNTIGLK
jgi:hypothetical protein